MLDSYHSGIQIQGIAIKQADPPADVNDAFKEVTAAQQDAKSYMNQANAYALQLTAKAQGEAAAFDKVYEQYKLAPEVTRRRMYYETMEQVLSKVDKTIVEAPASRPICRCPRCRTAAVVGASAMIELVRRRPLLIAIVGVILLVILLGSFPIVPETEQAVVVRFGKPVRILNRYLAGRPIGGQGAGISYRIPFAEEVVWIDKRVLDVDMAPQQVLSTDQRRLQVDAFARYRIVDPLLMYIRATTVEKFTGPAEDHPRLGSAQRIGQAAVRRAPFTRAAGRDG